VAQDRSFCVNIRILINDVNRTSSLLVLVEEVGDDEAMVVAFLVEEINFGTFWAAAKNLLGTNYGHYYNVLQTL
jgi:hypothetical protein